MYQKLKVTGNGVKLPLTLSFSVQASSFFEAALYFGSPDRYKKD